MKMRILGVVALTFVALCGQADASLMTYIGSDVGANSTDARPNSDAAAAAFDAAVNGFSIIDFESAPLGGFTNLLVAPGVTASNGSVINGSVGNPDRLFGYNTTSGGSKHVTYSGGSMTFTFASAIDAFGVYISGLQGAVVGPQSISYAGNSIDIPDLPGNDGGIAFVGFTDVGASITSVTLTFAGDIVSIDDVRYGRVRDGDNNNPIPEPATVVIWSLMAAMGLVVYRRRKSA